MAISENGPLQESSAYTTIENPSSSSLYTRPVPSLFRDAYAPETAAPQLKGQDLPVQEEVPRDEEPAKALVPATGTSFERFNSYVNNNFGRLDADGNGNLSAKEVQVSLAATVNQDEIQMLSWMNEHIDTLQSLGDYKAGISRKDLKDFHRANEQGTGSLSYAVREYDLFYGGIGSVAGAAVFGWLTKASNFRKVCMAAFLMAGSAAVHAGIYGLKDRPKIDRVIDDLNGLPNLSENSSGAKSLSIQQELESGPHKIFE